MIQAEWVSVIATLLQEQVIALQKRFFLSVGPFLDRVAARTRISLNDSVMDVMNIQTGSIRAAFIMSAGLLASCGDQGGEGPIVPPPPAPAEYADKHMPTDWWGDAQKLEEGRKLFLGETNPDVNCASCHGKDGKPVKAGATDFRNPERMKLYSDSVWFWRISEGVANTKMKGWKSKLSEEDRWKLVLYERSFGLAGKTWNEEKKQWGDAVAQ